MLRLRNNLWQSLPIPPLTTHPSHPLTSRFGSQQGQQTKLQEEMGIHSLGDFVHLRPQFAQPSTVTLIEVQDRRARDHGWIVAKC